MFMRRLFPLLVMIGIIWFCWYAAHKSEVAQLRIQRSALQQENAVLKEEVTGLKAATQPVTHPHVEEPK